MPRCRRSAPRTHVVSLEVTSRWAFETFESYSPILETHLLRHRGRRGRRWALRRWPCQQVVSGFWAARGGQERAISTPSCAVLKLTRCATPATSSKRYAVARTCALVLPLPMCDRGSRVHTLPWFRLRRQPVARRCRPMYNLDWSKTVLK